MALTEAQRKANDTYIEGNYSQVKLSMPIKEAMILDYYCKEKGIKKAGFIRESIKEIIGKDKWDSLEKEHEEDIKKEIERKKEEAKKKQKRKEAIKEDK